MSSESFDAIHMLSKKLSEVHPAPNPGLRDRIIASRAEGVRAASVVLAASDRVGRDDLLTSLEGDASLWRRSPSEGTASGTREHGRTHWSRWMAVGLAASLAIVAVLRAPKPVEAGVISGSLQLSSETPRVGELVTVRYVSGGLVGRPEKLHLRARIRTVLGESYEDGVPVVVIASLHRIGGAEYEGRFTLPDSVLYAALAVEDSAGTVVDDFGGRAWEVLRGDGAGTPLLSALDQRAHDMMGRSWEEGMATARRMVALYPDSLRAWSWLQNYEEWMLLRSDSTRAIHRERIALFDERYRDRHVLPAELIGQFYWYATADSLSRRYWRERLLREAPRSSFASQERLIDIGRHLYRSADTVEALHAFERLWPEVSADRRGQIASGALGIVPRRDAHASTFDRWGQRLVAATSNPDVERRVAVRALAFPSLRADAMNRLRDLVRRTYADSTTIRRLWESDDAYRRRLAEAPREPLLALGRALMAEGSLTAARDTFRLALESGWDRVAFEDYARLLEKLGDSVGARQQWARVAADPRSAEQAVDALNRRMRGEVGDSAWAALVGDAGRTLATRVMIDAIRRRIDDVSLTTFDGRSLALETQRGTAGTMVIFWSKDCGPAVEALPALQRASDRLDALGFRTVTIAEQPVRDAALDSVIRTKKITFPVYLDRGGAAGKAFNNWGTPQIYLLDRDGRLMFRATSEIDLALLQAHAMVASAR